MAQKMDTPGQASASRVRELVQLILRYDDETCSLAKIVLELILVIADPQGNQDRYGLARIAIADFGLSTGDFDELLEQYTRSLQKQLSVQNDEEPEHAQEEESPIN